MVRPTWEEFLEAETRPTVRRETQARPALPGLTLLAHPDASRVGERSGLPQLGSGREVRLSRSEPPFSQPGAALQRPLAVLQLSRKALLLRPIAGGGIVLDPAGSPTEVEADGEPLSAERTFPAAEIERGVVLLLGRRIALLLHRFRPHLEPDLPHYDLVGESDALLEVRRQIRRLSDLDVPVLLRGETGTGKELIARALHHASPRRERPYLAINLGAVPPTLASAELFGAARGAFTGADRKRSGYFSRAHGGTLFLDEIGEVPPDVQPLLLRALENGEIQPVGSEEILRVDVRTLAATDSDLDAAIAAGRFRSPLFHRLAGYEIHVPALRERRDDIGRLFFHFLRAELRALKEEHRLDDPGPEGRPWVPAELVARLVRAPWPGNVRQLRNVARQVAVDGRGLPEVRIGAQLERLLLEREEAPQPEEPAPRRRFRSPREVSDEELLEALRANRFQPAETARALGLSRPALYARIEACPQAQKAIDLAPQAVEAALAESGGRLEEAAERLAVSVEGLKRRIRQLGLKPPRPS